MINVCKVLSVGLILLLVSQLGFAITYKLPADGSDVVGEVKVIRARTRSNFDKISRHYDVGFYELREANPKLNPKKIPYGSLVVLPTQFILPPGPRKGIVINLAELRLYYYPPGKNIVVTEPVGIGKVGWNTITGDLTIIQRRKDPVWNVPESVREAKAKEGILLPRHFPPGPENPLGKYALRLSIPNYLIHGTVDPRGVGKRVSAGCVRMFPEDIEELYYSVRVGTPVRIVDLPYKSGWKGDKLYLEAHVPLQEEAEQYAASTDPMAKVITTALHKHSGDVNWAIAELVGKRMSGMPQVIGEDKIIERVIAETARSDNDPQSDNNVQQNPKQEIAAIEAVH